jgi:DNA-binding transcriptional MocR family regulator
MDTLSQTPDSLPDQLARKIGLLIEQGLLKPGARLPSIRAGSVEYGVAKNTLVAAYERLVAIRYVRAEHGSGFYVCDLSEKAQEARPPHIAQAVDLIWLLREQLEQNYAVRVGDGRPPQAWMEGSELGRHLRPLDLGKRPVGEGYSTPCGYPPLRERVAIMLCERSIKVSASQVLLTAGANHALDILIRHLTQPGDTVLVDSPGYYPLFGKLRLAMVDVVGVRRTAEGPDCDDLAAKAAASKAKVFFTQSLAQNPTGNSISISCSHRVLQVASRFGMSVVDDDPFSDLFPASSPRLAALDQLEQVIQVGTFTKTLSAGLRVGYIAAADRHIRALTDLKMLTIVNSSGYVERIVNDLIVSGQYRRHLKRLKSRISNAQDTAVTLLESLGIKVFGMPSGGYYIWGELPDHVDDIDVARQAAEESIFIAPGSMFAPDRKLDLPAMRVNIAYATDPRFSTFYRRFMNEHVARNL